MAENKKKSVEGGGDTTLGRLFPELSSELFGGPSFSNYNIGGYGPGQAAPSAEGGGDQRRKLELMADLWRQGLEAQQAAQVRPAEEYEAQAKAQDPVKFAQQRREAGLADPFGAGGYFEGRRAADIMTPEEIMASQGGTAANQWASMRQPLTEEQKQNLQGPGGVKVAAQRGAGEFDPEELRRLNEQYVARRTYM
jgi:hypothetical protein